MRWHRLSGTVAGLLVSGRPHFRFSAPRVTPEQLAEARHDWELVSGTSTTLLLDGFHLGIGGDTGWSRNVHPEFLLRPGRYTWSIQLSTGEAAIEPGDCE